MDCLYMQQRITNLLQQHLLNVAVTHWIDAASFLPTRAHIWPTSLANPERENYTCHKESGSSLPCMLCRISGVSKQRRESVSGRRMMKRGQTAQLKSRFSMTCLGMKPPMQVGDMLFTTCLEARHVCIIHQQQPYASCQMHATRCPMKLSKTLQGIQPCLSPV